MKMLYLFTRQLYLGDTAVTMRERPISVSISTSRCCTLVVSCVAGAFRTGPRRDVAKPDAHATGRCTDTAIRLAFQQWRPQHGVLLLDLADSAVGIASVSGQKRTSCLETSAICLIAVGLTLLRDREPHQVCLCPCRQPGQDLPCLPLRLP